MLKLPYFLITSSLFTILYKFMIFYQNVASLDLCYEVWVAGKICSYKYYCLVFHS